MKDDFSHTDIILAVFDKEKQILTLYDVYNDGTKNLYTQFTMSSLQSVDIGKACEMVGKAILLGIIPIAESLYDMNHEK